MTRSCANCRFGEDVGAGLGRCTWVVGTQDEAGDRMPRWAHDIVAHHPEAVGGNHRAEECPAFEAAA